MRNGLARCVTFSGDRRGHEVKMGNVRISAEDRSVLCTGKASSWFRGMERVGLVFSWHMNIGVISFLSLISAVTGLRCASVLHILTPPTWGLST
jgi:hypothetical protein